MMSRRFLAAMILIVAGLAFGLPAWADEPISQRDDESRSILERIKLYQERHASMANSVLNRCSSALGGAMSVG